MKNFLSSLKGRRTSRERDRTPSEAARSPKEAAIRRTPSAAVSAPDAALATPRYTPERQTPEQYITPRPRVKSSSPYSDESPGSPHAGRPIAPNALGRPGSPGTYQPVKLTERNVASVSNLSPWHQPLPGPVARPVQDPYWDVQSRASSAGYSAAQSVATAHTGATGATGATGVTYASAATAPAGSFGGARGGGSSRMRMMLPSPSRTNSRPPSRAASIAGDFRRGNFDSPSSRFTPNRPPRGSISAGGLPSRGPINRSGIMPKRLELPDDEVLPDSETDNVKVFVRTRPINEREIEFGGMRKCLEVTGPQTLRLETTPDPHNYTFDCVAGEAFSQEALYNVAGRPIVDNCLNGFNSCIFAYGQTGAGKTYTMLGTGFEPDIPADAAANVQELRGLIPRVFEDTFVRLGQMGQQTEAGAQREVSIRCSFLEIYNEVITDLLNPEATHLLIREDVKKGIFVENLSQHVVHNMADVAALLEKGQLNRKIGETMMNSESSRSHSVFMAVLECKTTDESGITHVLSSRLNLVDLAGSERQRQSGATGDRLKEASGINVSLTVLGQVIMSLVDVQHGRRQHVPYRNSRLTFLLQESLGGNAKTVMIANVSPAATNMADTLSTLRFAQRVKAIRNTVYRNEDTRGDAAQLRVEIRRLKAELHMWQQAAAAGELGSPRGPGGRLRSPASTPSGPAHLQSPQSAAASPWQDPGTTMAALTGALRREDNNQKECRRLQKELEALQGLLREREADLQRCKAVIKLKEGLITRLEKSVNEAEEFSFASGEKEAIIVELKEEARILRARMENNPEVKRHTAENVQLTAELARYQAYVDREERAALLADVDGLRGEVLRLQDAVERLSAAPQVKEIEAAALRAAHDGAMQLENALAAAADKGIDASKVAALRTRLWEEETATKEAQAALEAATKSRDALAAEKAQIQTQLAALEAQMARPKGGVHRAIGTDSPTSSPRGSPLEALTRKLNTEVEQLRAENARLQAANTRRTVEQTTARAAEALNGSLMAENAELRRANASLQAGDGAAADGAAAGGAGADSPAEQTQRLRIEVASLQAQLAAARSAGAATGAPDGGGSGPSDGDSASLRQQLHEARAHGEALQGDLDRALQQTMAAGIAARTRSRSDAEVGTLRAELAQSAATAEAARRDADAAAEELAVLRGRVQSLQAEADAAQSSAARTAADEKRARAAQAAALQAAMADRQRGGRSASGDLGAVQQPRTPGSPPPHGPVASPTSNGFGRADGSVSGSSPPPAANGFRRSLQSVASLNAPAANGSPPKAHANGVEGLNGHAATADGGPRDPKDAAETAAALASFDFQRPDFQRPNFQQPGPRRDSDSSVDSQRGSGPGGGGGPGGGSGGGGAAAPAPASLAWLLANRDSVPNANALPGQ